MEHYQGDPHKFGYQSRNPIRTGIKPVEEGKEYEVDIKELSRRGEGLARIEGFVIFVPNTKVGDRVRVRVTQITERYASAVIA